MNNIELKLLTEGMILNIMMKCEDFEPTDEKIDELFNCVQILKNLKRSSISDFTSKQK